MKTLAEFAKLVGGTVKGNSSDKVKSVAPLETAIAGDLTFVFNRKGVDKAARSSASFFVVPENFAKLLEGKTLIVVKEPRTAMAKILEAFDPYSSSKREIHKTAIIGENCKISKNAAIGPYSIIGNNVVIGDGTIIHGHVTVYDRVVIGKNSIIHSGCVIGVDGFGFCQDQSGKHLKIPQVGTVIIGDNVELYANVCIARATLGATIIGNGTKIDDMVQVAHNCVIGENCAIAAHTALAGSVTLGKNVIVSGHAAIVDHITVGENSIVLAKAGVTKNFPANSILSGFPAQDHKKELAFRAFLRSLPEKLKGK